jgi:tetraacyldisaccharide 4'-kinase
MRSPSLYWKTLVRGGGGIVGPPLRGLLWGVSQAYALMSRWRHVAYDRGWLRSRRPPGPVIVSIGNLVMGGTGKTPLVMKFGQEFQATGSLAILTRGYRSPAEKAHTPVYIPPGHPSNPIICGDEPCLLAQRLSRAHVVVGRNRYASANLAVAAGAQLLVLDDGLQHRQLARDFDIVVVDADDPLGKGHLFPRGTLRECPKGLRRAQLIVVNYVRSADHFQRAQAHLRAFTAAPMVGMRPIVSGFPITPGTKVGLFCGIGQPERFVDTVRELGVNIVGTLFSDDHRLPSPQAFEAFAKRCQQQGAAMLLCTEKDTVKLSRRGHLPLSIAAVPMELAIVEGHAHWFQLIDQIRARISDC